MIIFVLMQNTELKDHIASYSIASLQVVVGVVFNVVGQVLIALRNKRVHQGGLWEFPGGKIEAGESVKQALTRELREELAILILTMEPLITISHHYSDLNVHLDVWRILSFSGEVIGNEGQEFRWVEPKHLTMFSFPEANYPIVNAIRLTDEYAILNGSKKTDLAYQLKELLKRGIKLIQLRLKTVTEDAVLQFFAWALPLCRARGVLLLVNSSVNGVHKVNADGLHLTGIDLLAQKKRPDHYAWVAASCHSLAELQHAQLIGVDFVVLAPVLATTTHPDAAPLGWSQFQQLVEKINLPVFALGGMKKTDKDIAKMAGAQGIAGISAFLQ